LSAIRKPTAIQSFFQTGNVWWDYYRRNIETIRPAEFENIIKLLSCGKLIKGYKTYCCSKKGCTHTKNVTFGCKSRFCPTCGKKATDLWVNKQRSILPQTDWQHITFTMPDKLWPPLKEKRALLKKIAKLAADTIQTKAKKRKINVAIFTAMHTFGRDLKWHVHIHLSVTMGGLSEDNSEWKKIRFSKKAIMPMWRKRVIKLMKDAQKSGEISVTAAMLEVQYHKKWIVHFAKPTTNAWRTISYLGRYIKRPPLSQSRLEHYDGTKVTFNYLNHKTGKYQKGTYSTDEFIQRFIQHIPDKGFRMIRYYGILANRVRGKLLPIVYDLIDQIVKPATFIGWAGLLKNAFGVDPLKCILCGSKMVFRGMTFGKSNRELKNYHEELATRQIIRL
jgi:hypothetical protein